MTDLNLQNKLFSVVFQLKQTFGTVLGSDCELKNDSLFWKHHAFCCNSSASICQQGCRVPNEFRGFLHPNVSWKESAFLSNLALLVHYSKIDRQDCHQDLSQSHSPHCRKHFTAYQIRWHTRLGKRTHHASRMVCAQVTIDVIPTRAKMAMTMTTFTYLFPSVQWLCSILPFANITKLER